MVSKVVKVVNAEDFICVRQVSLQRLLRSILSARS